MSYAPHRSDLISAELGARGALVLYREISGQTWTRRVALHEFLTLMEAAVVLQVHRITLYDWIEKGLLPRYKTEHGTLLIWGDVYDFARTRGLLR
jgi:excisionase family DNA binding protein